MNITLQGTNLELTDDIRRFVDDKLEDTFRAFGDMNTESVMVDLELERTTTHHRSADRLFRCEVNVSVPGRMIRVEETADDLYKAIVQAKHTLTRRIRTWREKLIDEQREGARSATDLSEG